MCFLCDDDEDKPGIAQNTRRVGEGDRFDHLKGKKAEQLRKGITSCEPLEGSEAHEKAETMERLHGEV